MKKLLKRLGLTAITSLIAAIGLMVVSDFTSAIPVASANEGCLQFKETGYYVCGRFLDYWRTHGGLAQQGFPVSDVFMERNAPPPSGDGKMHPVQYFQRARFEYHLENQAPYDVLLGLLGGEQFSAKYASPKPLPLNDGCQQFLETGFQVCGRFLEYWQTHGGLSQQGFPISDIIDEQNAPPPAGDGKVHKVQYFQRARFEIHPENQPPFDVLLGLLGQEQFQTRYGQNGEPDLQVFTVVGKRYTSEIGGKVAEAGMTLFVLDVLVSNNSTQPLSIDIASLGVLTPQSKSRGQFYKSSTGFLDRLPTSLTTQTLEPNTYVIGEVVFVIPPPAVETPYALIYQDSKVSLAYPF